MDLRQLKVLVTGGGGVGVGGGVCEVLDSFGATLYINDLIPEKARAAASRYQHATPVPGDITRQKDLDDIFATIRSHGGFVNGLVNNAGIGLSKKAHEVEAHEFDRLYSVDIRAVWEVSKYFVRQLLPTGQPGSIVNISSVHAFATQPGFAIYCSAKNAVEGLTKGMAYELGKNRIRVNSVGPGLVHAEQNYDLIKTWTEDPDQYLKDFVNYQQAIPDPIAPRDCGNAVAFFLSDLSASITGQSIYVDAGTTIMIHSRDFIEGK